MLKFLKMTCVTADNAHIAELINAVKVMISKQKQQATALIEATSFTAALWFRVTAAATESPLVCEISTCLAREIVIRYFNTTSENCVWSITQLVKKINKKKSQNVSEKVLTVRRLFSENIMMIINIEKTKKQLKQNNN